MFKRIVALVLAVAITMMLLAACGSSEKEPQQTVPVQTTPVQTEPVQTNQSEPAQDGESLVLPESFKKDGAYVVTHEQMAMMLNLALMDENLYMGFDGISNGVASYSVVTFDDFDNLNIWCSAPVSDASQPIEYLSFVIPVDNTEENHKIFTQLICIACSVADPTLSVSDAAGLIADAETVQLDNESSAKIIEYGDLQFMLGFSNDYTFFYIL